VDLSPSRSLPRRRRRRRRPILPPGCNLPLFPPSRLPFFPPYPLLLVGYILEIVRNEKEFPRRCKGAILLPGENSWSRPLRGALYLLCMLYLFCGINVIADKFMNAIELITSKNKYER
jgi:hypothetical protein